ncbi:MAG: DUF6785 family protein [Phycisphaeraceae bacterium]
MTLRALTLGCLLALAIAGFTYFNDQVIRQTFLLGNHLPASVFGVALVLLLAINPLIAATSPRRMLTAGELAVIVALGLAVCAWPGSNLMRIVNQLVTLPSHMRQVKSNWDATNVLAYVPDGSPRLAEAYVADFDLLLATLQDDAPPAHVAHLQRHLAGDAQAVLRDTDAGGYLGPGARRTLVRGINRALGDDTFLDPAAFAALDLPAPVATQLSGAAGFPSHERLALARELLERSLPGVIHPRPAGEGVLLLGGRDDPAVTGPLITGHAGDATLTPLDLPWSAWWPTIRLWIVSALLMGLAGIFMVLIVHPQWAHRELMPYPTVVFLEEATRRTGAGWLPDLTRSHLFWIGFVGVAVIHTLNGLHQWHEWVPEIQRELDFNPLRELFPNASRVPDSRGVFHPVIFFSAIGFGFFINTRIAMSLGVSALLWVILGAIVIGSGHAFTNTMWQVGSNGNMLRFGAYLGLTLMILYFGRRYYARVLARAACLMPPSVDVPAYAVWAARGLVLACAGVVYLLAAYASLSPVMAVLLIALVLMILLVLARLNAETGLFYAQPIWLPSVILAGLLGVQGIGPEALLILGFASIVFVADPREAIAPYIANALRMSERMAGSSPARIAPILIGVTVVGLAVAFVVTLTIQYNRGFQPEDIWSRMLPELTLDYVATAINELHARDELGQTVGMSGLDHLRSAQPSPGVIAWAALGLGLVWLCAVARLRLAWWPLHPVTFVVWGTYPMTYFAFSFFLAAILKWAVIRVGGERAYHHVKPLAVGLIAAELLAILAFSAAGTIYYFTTGLRPVFYRILPG